MVKMRFVLGAALFLGLASTPAYASTAYQGSDYSRTFSSGYNSEACDKESDGNQVHNDFDSTSGATYHAYDPDGNGGVCGTHAQSASKVQRHRAVEYAVGPDATGDWVYGH